MSHYEERVEADLAEIRESTRQLTDLVEANVRHAVRAIATLDRAAAGEGILADQPINRMVRRNDHLCHVFVARHLPSAGILRLISAVLRVNVALERIGDYAVTICREVQQLSKLPPESVAGDIDMMAEQSRRMLTDSVNAFLANNAEMARGTRKVAAAVDDSMDRVFDSMTKEAEDRTRPMQDLFGLMMVFNRIERISDQAKNICDETIFAATGELIAPKTPRILFVDEHNSCWGLLAEALGRKAYPKTAHFASAGWDPAQSAEDALAPYLQEKGLDLPNLVPSPLPTTRDELDDYHVIIGLGARGREHLAKLPFRTILLDWDIFAPEGPPAGAPSGEDLERVSRNLRQRLADLMETLHGEVAP